MATARYLFVVLPSLIGCSDAECDLDAPGTICTIAGTGTQGFSRDGGPATRASLYLPIDIAGAPNGELWVLDFNNYVVRAIDADGVMVTRVGNGLVGDSPEPGSPAIPALEASFNHSTDLLFHGGYLYIAGWHNSRVKRVRLADMMLENFAGAGRRTYYDGDGGPALDASFDLPVSVAVDPGGSIVVSDQANQVIRRVDENGIITTIAGRCIVDTEVPCAPGQQPVACPGSNKLTCGGVESCQGVCAPSFAGDGRAATEARFGHPVGQVDPAGGIAYDHLGCLVVADSDNHRIRRVDPAGVITTIAGDGTSGFAGEGGAATSAQLNYPNDVEIGRDNSVYFTDVQNNCVRKIDPDGVLTTVAGRCGIRGFGGDGGPAEHALLDRPFGIALEGDRLYIADSFNNRIRSVRLQ